MHGGWCRILRSRSFRALSARTRSPSRASTAAKSRSNPPPEIRHLKLSAANAAIYKLGFYGDCEVSQGSFLCFEPVMHGRVERGVSLAPQPLRNQGRSWGCVKGSNLPQFRPETARGCLCTQNKCWLQGLRPYLLPHDQFSD